MPPAGEPKLILTGQLGDVMKESAQAALTMVKSRSAALGIDPTVFDISASISMCPPAPSRRMDRARASRCFWRWSHYSADVRAQRHRHDRRDLAAWPVLPIGGVKEKVLAATRAGIKAVMLRARNKKDLEDVPERARAGEIRLA
jgi:ATP-dependent Lon protease